MVQKHQRCFYWVDELNAEMEQEEGDEDVSRNTYHAKGGDQWKVFTVMLLLIIFFLICMLIGR